MGRLVLGVGDECTRVGFAGFVDDGMADSGRASARTTAMMDDSGSGSGRYPLFSHSSPLTCVARHCSMIDP